MGCTCASVGNIYELEINGYWKSLPIRKMGPGVFLDNFQTFNITQIKDKRRDEFITMFFNQGKNNTITKNLFFTKFTQLNNSKKKEDFIYFLMSFFFLIKREKSPLEYFIKYDKLLIEKCYSKKLNDDNVEHYFIDKEILNEIILNYVSLISITSTYLNALVDDKQDFVSEVERIYRKENQELYIKNLLQNHNKEVSLDDFFLNEYPIIIDDSKVREELYRIEIERESKNGT
jgi:hypothetical protein